MKKSLIALAVVASFSAPAFADPTFYGVVDGAIANVNNSGQKSQTLAVSGGLATSRLGLKGSEDLGDGLKAIYNLEYALDIQSNTGIGATPASGGAVTNLGSTSVARQQLLGLSGTWGTIATGRLQTTAKDFGDKFDPTAGSLVSPLQNLATSGKTQFLVGSNTGATRANRALAYISPNIEGFSVAVNYSTALAGVGNAGVAAGGADANTTAVLLGGYFDKGPVSVGVVYVDLGSPSTAAATALGSTTNEKELALGGSYDFGVAKVNATYQSTHNDGANGAASNVGNTDKLWSLSGVIPAGGGAVVASYANATIATDTTGNSDGKAYTFAYLYSFSKTATLYGAYSHVSNGSASTNFSVANDAIGGATSTPGASSGLFAIGLKKAF